MYYVYILQCCDGSYYVGLTEDVSARFELHNSGNGPSYTANRRPVQLAYQESWVTLEEAVRREKQLKGWTRAKKEALISHNLKKLSQLAACRNRRRRAAAEGACPEPVEGRP